MFTLFRTANNTNVLLAFSSNYSLALLANHYPGLVDVVNVLSRNQYRAIVVEECTAEKIKVHFNFLPIETNSTTYGRSFRLSNWHLIMPYKKSA